MEGRKCTEQFERGLNDEIQADLRPTLSARRCPRVRGSFENAPSESVSLSFFQRVAAVHAKPNAQSKLSETGNPGVPFEFRDKDKYVKQNLNGFEG